jgi:hypothetical protein
MQRGDTVGDDAEYQIELDAEIAAAERIASTSAGSSSSRPAFVLVDSEFEEIWEASIPGRTPGLFAAVRDSGVGLECFQTRWLPPEVPNLASLDPFVVPNDGDYEVLIATERDAQALRHRADEMSAKDRALLDRVLADMFYAMAEYIEQNPGNKLYVFARTV